MKRQTVNKNKMSKCYCVYNRKIYSCLTDKKENDVKET